MAVAREVEGQVEVGRGEEDKAEEAAAAVEAGVEVTEAAAMKAEATEVAKMEAAAVAEEATPAVSMEVLEVWAATAVHKEGVMAMVEGLAAAT